MIGSDEGYVLLRQLTIPIDDYVKISDKRRVKPYVKGKCRVPKKYLDKDGELLPELAWSHKGYLIQKDNGLVIVANNKTAGQPRYKKINGQDIYNGNISRTARASFVKAMHNQLGQYVRGIEPLMELANYPLGIHCHFYVHDKGKHNIDNDNRWIWEKVLQDTLRECNVIPEDNPYIIWENLKRTILVSPESEQKLVINIYGYNNAGQ